MRINRPREDTESFLQMKEALELLIAQPTPEEESPCDNCQTHRPANCSSSCVDAQASLSSDPIRFPIEEKVVSLVFELTATRLIETCWSCEGHFSHDGKLWKLPQITFYATNSVYPQLLLRHIRRLINAKKLGYEWHIVLSDFGQTYNISYNIEPNLNNVVEPRLGRLQQDLKTISENLCESLKQLAKEMLDEMA